ncbi:phytanoyl-CoA dioxygenase family protein [Methyloversatilis sp.]|uniref:phytanoyl-CoA dioxygenase family protein n=1 Tax=Methyloversatilis sp. TaxID=2569862 RepID=UPI003D2AB5BA
MTANFLLEYVRIQRSYARLARKGLSNRQAREVVEQGFSVVDDWYDSGTVTAMRAAVPDVAALTVEPQSPSVRSLHDASSMAAFAPFFEDSRIRDVVETIMGARAERVRDWAQVRLADGPRGAFDEFFHIDSFKHRIKAFLYLTDVGHDDGTLVVVPNSTTGFWRVPLARELYSVERRSAASWDTEAASYDAISGRIENHFAGCLTHYRAELLMRRRKLSPVPLRGKAGTLVIWDSRCLHKHIPSATGRRVMLEAVFACAGAYG